MPDCNRPPPGSHRRGFSITGEQGRGASRALRSGAGAEGETSEGLRWASPGAPIASLPRLSASLAVVKS